MAEGLVARQQQRLLLLHACKQTHGQAEQTGHGAEAPGRRRSSVGARAARAARARVRVREHAGDAGQQRVLLRFGRTICFRPIC